MIIAGYQGIGKSTLASKDKNIIDLESSSFWRYDKFHNTKSRCEDWYVYYCQVAMDLSRQGYTVFVSCHKEVRDFLSSNSTEHFNAIFPSKKIKKEWLQKLTDMYNDTKSDKDKRVLEYAEQYFDKDIEDLWYECQYNVEYYHDVKIINDINYDLSKLIKELD